MAIQTSHSWSIIRRCCLFFLLSKFRLEICGFGQRHQKEISRLHGQLLSRRESRIRAVRDPQLQQPDSYRSCTGRPYYSRSCYPPGPTWNYIYAFYFVRFLFRIYKEVTRCRQDRFIHMISVCLCSCIDLVNAKREGIESSSSGRNLAKAPFSLK